MNKTSELFYAGWVGVLFGILICLFLISLPGSDLSIHKALKEECEKSLPRDKTCKLIAVVNEDAK